MKRAFTLVELLVVVAMLAVLIGAVGSSVAKAQQRARIAKATQDIKELTNAILAYENYAPDDFGKSATDAWRPTTKGNLDFLLGGKSTDAGAKIPVLYNAQLRNDKMLDPWRHEYQFKIKQVGTIGTASTSSFYVSPLLPNVNRLRNGERQ